MASLIYELSTISAIALLIKLVWNRTRTWFWSEAPELNFFSSLGVLFLVLLIWRH